jgi:hypothetical protein
MRPDELSGLKRFYMGERMKQKTKDDQPPFKKLCDDYLVALENLQRLPENGDEAMALFLVNAQVLIRCKIRERHRDILTVLTSKGRSLGLLEHETYRKALHHLAIQMGVHGNPPGVTRRKTKKR